MSSTYTLLDNLECKGLDIVGDIYNPGEWEFDTNNKDITTERVFVNNGSQITVYMGSGTWKLVGNPFWGDVFECGENATLYAESSTIEIDKPGGSFQFKGGGHTYHDIEILSGTSMRIEGDSAFNDFKIEPNVDILLDGSATVSSFNAVGASGNPINITEGTLSKPSGFVQCDYLMLADSTATGGAKWYAGENSINNGGNKGWIFRKRKYQLPARKV